MIASQRMRCTRPGRYHAKQFKVSFEALCIRFIEVPGRALSWSLGQRLPSGTGGAARTRSCRGHAVRRTATAEAAARHAAADTNAGPGADGVEMPASVWCATEAPHT